MEELQLTKSLMYASMLYSKGSAFYHAKEDLSSLKYYQHALQVILQLIGKENLFYNTCQENEFVEAFLIWKRISSYNLTQQEYLEVCVTAEMTLYNRITINPPAKWKDQILSLYLAPNLCINQCVGIDKTFNLVPRFSDFEDCWSFQLNLSE